MACLEGPHREGKAGFREIVQQDLGHTPSLGSKGGMIWSWDNWTSTCKMRKLDTDLTPSTKIS